MNRAVSARRLQGTTITHDRQVRVLYTVCLDQDEPAASCAKITSTAALGQLWARSSNGAENSCSLSSVSATSRVWTSCRYVFDTAVDVRI